MEFDPDSLLKAYDAGAVRLGDALNIAEKIKKLVGKGGDPKVTSLTLDLYGQLLEAKAAQGELQSELQSLKLILADAQEKKAELERYELRASAAGSLLYAIKPDAKHSGEPDHYLCPTCYNGGDKSILQPTFYKGQMVSSSCGKCGASFIGSFT